VRGCHALSRPAPDLTVLHVLEAIEGGTARHVVDLVEHTHGVDHHVAVPTVRVGGVTDELAAGRITAAGGTVHVVEMRRRPHDRRNLAALVQLRSLVRRLRPDVVHGHSSIGGVLARVVATAARRPARVYTPNGLAAGRGATLVERALGPFTDRFVAVSASERDEVLRRRLLPDDRLVVVPNGIPATRPPPLDLRAAAGVPPGVPLVGSMGRLAAQKAPEVLVRAFQLVAAEQGDVHFVVIGDGPQRALFDDAVAASQLGARLHHVPALPEAARYLGDLDVFVLASRFEGGPYAPLEAMRAGVPVVLTDVVGNRDVVDDDRNGVLVPVDDPDSLRSAITALLRDEERRRRLAAAGADDVRERFSVEAMAAAHLALYRDALERRVR